MLKNVAADGALVAAAAVALLPVSAPDIEREATEEPLRDARITVHSGGGVAYN